MNLVLAPPLIRARKLRNLPFVRILTLFFLANLASISERTARWSRVNRSSWASRSTS